MREGALLLAGTALGALGALGAMWLSRRRPIAAARPAAARRAPERSAADAAAGGVANGVAGATSGKRSRSQPRHTRVSIDCAGSAFEYAKTVEHVVRRGDQVLVLGAMNEDMMRAVAARMEGEGGQIVHVDMQRKDGSLLHPSALSSDIAHLRTACADVTDVRFVLGLGIAFCVIFIDLTVISGNDLVLDQLAFVQALCALFASSCRHVVIKSRSLTLLAAHTVDAAGFGIAVHSVLAALLTPASDPAGAAMDLDGLPATLSSHVPAAAPHSIPHQPSPGVVPPPIFIGAMGVYEYRLAALGALLPSDSVLEIGCHSGTTTRRVHARLRAMGGTGLVVGVDIGKSIIEQARGYGGAADIRYEVADAWDSGSLLAISPCFTVLLVDVGGVSSHYGLLEALCLLRQLKAAFTPSVRLIIVKSKCMRDFALQAHSATRLWRGDDADAWRRLAHLSAAELVTSALPSFVLEARAELPQSVPATQRSPDVPVPPCV